CYCGNKYNQSDEVGKDLCPYNCRGNRTSMCGGRDAVSMYNSIRCQLLLRSEFYPIFHGEARRRSLQQGMPGRLAEFLWRNESQVGIRTMVDLISFTKPNRIGQ
ncbi:hypothetical protein Ahia01_000455500, partial [Argonauta hians]